MFEQVGCFFFVVHVFYLILWVKNNIIRYQFCQTGNVSQTRLLVQTLKSYGGHFTVRFPIKATNLAIYFRN